MSLGSSIASYHSVARTLEALPVKVELPRLFQVDLHLAGRMTLGPKVVDEIVRGGELLESLTQPFEDNWSRFRESFNARYETREVPLVEVLDEEAGIGFGGSGAGFAPLLDGLGTAEMLRQTTWLWMLVSYFWYRARRLTGPAAPAEVAAERSLLARLA